MDLGMILFGLRVLGAGFLLLFVGSMGWVLYRDLQVAGEEETETALLAGYLLVTQSDDAQVAIGDKYVLATATLLGRAGHSQIVLAGAYVSYEHALVSWREQAWWVEDLGSRNGTSLNGVLLNEATVVRTGDMIQIGEVALQLVLGIGEI